MQSAIRAVGRFASNPPRAAVAFACAGLLVLAGVADGSVTREIGLELLYLLPIGLAGWYLDLPWALGYSVLGVGIWLLIDLMYAPTVWEPLVSVWNGLTRLAVFVMVAWLLWALHESIRRGQALTRLDELSGARNAAAFYEMARTEIEHARRTGRPFTVAYFDVCGCDLVAKAHGAGAGERLLRVVASAIGGDIRSTDALARLHDDRFGVFFPDTDRVDAGAVLLKISDRAAKGIQTSGWDAGLAMAAATFMSAPASVNDMRRVLEEGLHAAREQGSGVIHHVVIS